MRWLIIIYIKLQDFILLFKIPMDTRKDFFKIYIQFGHALPRTFTSPALVSPFAYIRNRKRCWYIEQLNYFSGSACMWHRQAAQRVSRRSSVNTNAFSNWRDGFRLPGARAPFSFVMSECTGVATTGRICVKFGIGSYGENVDKLQIWLKSDSNFGHFTWRHKCLYCFFSL